MIWIRIARMLLDPGFWWSILFGTATITGSAWYAGLQDPTILIGVGCAWFLVAVMMNY